ncbi:MAG TPA: AAA family ATPase [Anaerolineae bacterium]|nr:AAA family ATPase [Anaerolineae bacterium]
MLPPSRPFQKIPNPYSPGVPLRQNSALFYGREDLFDFIVTNSHQKALILVGQRRTGKTSALLRLDKHLPDKIIPIYIDCQSLGVMPGMAAFFHDIAWTIADILDRYDILIDIPEIDVWQANPAGYFQRRFIPQVQALLPPLTKLLFVFDEFEAFENLVQDEILPPTLFPFLRHMMQHSQGISFVFVGTRRLEEMTSNYWSVLFNIALYRSIDLLSEEASLRLVCEPVAPYLVYDDLALDKIYRVTAGHPYFLQLVCYTIVTHANQKKLSYITISEVNEALSDMLRLGEVHFAYLWQRSNQEERALLTAIAYLMDRTPRFHPEDIVQYLNQYNINLTPSALTSALHTLVHRDILREITDRATTLYELKIGLVGLWVAQNKSVTKLYEITPTQA